MLRCAAVAAPVPFIANGDFYSWDDAVDFLSNEHVSSLMLARGALIKPWLFQEIKERRHIDMTASQRLEIVRDFCNNALDAFGSDTRGVETSRRFLLEWLSFAHRYVPVGLLEHLPPALDHRPPRFRGRCDMETLLADPSATAWARISEMFLGPVEPGFHFTPKHQANAWKDPSETDGV